MSDGNKCSEWDLSFFVDAATQREAEVSSGGDVVSAWGATVEWRWPGDGSLLRDPPYRIGAAREPRPVGQAEPPGGDAMSADDEGSGPTSVKPVLGPDVDGEQVH